ncbi:hypothetical protein ABBQ38_007875 [Trebouxia sp. C0009 RCD-2024]
MLPATRDIWQGHPSTQAWKVDQQLPDLITELHQAAWAGGLDKIQVLANQGSDVTARDRAGRSPLHYAAAGNQAGAIMLLVSHHASVRSTNDSGDFPLHTAAVQGSVAAIQALLSQGADPSATNDQEQTPLYKAVEAKQAVATQALCQFGPGAVNQADEWGLCPLHIAARAGNADIVTLLLLAQADPTRQSWDKRTPLHFAAQHRHPAIIRQLLVHPSLRESPSSAMQYPNGFAMQHPIGSAVQHPPGSAMPNPPGSAMPNPPGSAMQHPPGSAMPNPPGFAMQHPIGSAMQHPPGSAAQRPLTPPAMHPQAPDIDQDQAQDMAEAALPKAQLQVDEARHNAQTDLHRNQILQQADPRPGCASIQEAASSLQSMQSGIQYEPDAGANGNEEPDATSNSSVGSVGQLDYTGQDAEAMQALLALTNDCSVQSPPRAHNPADHFRWQQHLLRLKDHQGNTALHLAVIEGLPESVQLLLQAGADTATPGDQQPSDWYPM